MTIIWRDEYQCSGYRADALVELVGMDRIDALRLYACHGANYDRGIADDLRAAASCAATGNDDAALYRFRSAEAQVGSGME